ncbi:hypothetical protein [uncultured Ralstonia sp.]|jgi:hypothetical protein|uniref:hypothetical protein n=1 Tax=Ralstonia sp. TaxID=54061 RepID=UPI0025F2A807|nr:hypothetical protein [uncultured Ralstonia sp.]
MIQMEDAIPPHMGYRFAHAVLEWPKRKTELNKTKFALESTERAMGYNKRGSSGLSARMGWERHAVDWQVIPTRRRLFQTSRLPTSRIPVLMLWLLAISVAIGIGRILMHRWW